MDKKRIVVLGGSFNPPTIAHAKLLKNTVQLLDAEFGIFVPSSDNYIKRKMSKQKQHNQVYTETERMNMLLHLCESAPELKVSTMEYGDDGHGHTYRTLQNIQKEYPGYEIIFIIGADKLSVIPHWHNHDNLFHEFSFCVAARGTADKDSAEKTIVADPKLNQFKEKFHVIPTTGDMSDVSSSQARELITQKKWTELKKILCKETVQYLQAK